MINVAAIRMQQFGVQFYQASLTAEDIDNGAVLTYAASNDGEGAYGSLDLDPETGAWTYKLDKNKLYLPSN